MQPALERIVQDHVGRTVVHNRKFMQGKESEECTNSPKAFNWADETRVDLN